MRDGRRRIYVLLSFIPLLALFGASYAISYCSTLVYDFIVGNNRNKPKHIEQSEDELSDQIDASSPSTDTLNSTNQHENDPYEVEDYDEDTVVVRQSLTHRVSFFEANNTKSAMWKCHKCGKPVYFGTFSTRLM